MKRDITGAENLYGPTIQGAIAQCPVCLCYTRCRAGDYKITCTYCNSIYQPRKMTCIQWNEWQENYANKMPEADKILLEMQP